MPRSDLQFATRKRRRYTLLALLFINPVLVIGLGVALLVAGLGIRSRTGPEAGWSQTTGWVAAVHYSWPYSNSEPTYVPVIAFRAADHVVMFSAPGTRISRRSAPLPG